MNDGGVHWVFGYGSLVWRPAFAYVERAPAHIDGYVRRFHQASTDHRGVPEAPGRVVTLEAEAGARCFGMAYAVAESDWAAVLEALDLREQNGYERLELPLHFARAERASVRGLVYRAGRDNPNYLGPASLEEIAAQICRSHGPSGANDEYVLELDAALRALGEPDPHVGALAELVRARQRVRRVEPRP